LIYHILKDIDLPVVAGYRSSSRNAIVFLLADVRLPCGQQIVLSTCPNNIFSGSMRQSCMMDCVNIRCRTDHPETHLQEPTVSISKLRR
jgi:hypothetical protein